MIRTPNCSNYRDSPSIFLSAAVATVWREVGEASQEQVVLRPAATLHDPRNSARPGDLSTLCG